MRSSKNWSAADCSKDILNGSSETAATYQKKYLKLSSIIRWYFVDYKGSPISPNLTFVNLYRLFDGSKPTDESGREHRRLRIPQANFPSLPNRLRSAAAATDDNNDDDSGSNNCYQSFNRYNSDPTDTGGELLNRNKSGIREQSGHGRLQFRRFFRLRCPKIPVSTEI